jgi:hypothetical protein
MSEITQQKATPHSSGKRMAQPGKHHPVKGHTATPTTWERERHIAAQPAQSRHQGSTMHLQKSLGKLFKRTIQPRS